MGWLPPSCAPHHYSKKDSSLLTRGKHLLTLHAECLERLIPAHAGKTSHRRRLQHSCRAHPRSRGENRLPAHSVHPSRGSSPLTRGKHDPGGAPARRARLIPAHAGKTGSATTACPPSRVHPSSRGENVRALAFVVPMVGLSPLTRGKPLMRGDSRSSARLIPAHTGKTRPRRRRHSARRAHPRSRGENPKTRSDRLLDPGSSPLTRGKLSFCNVRDVAFRLIPAHAGKTTVRQTGRRRFRAHPRSRGENTDNVGRPSSSTGSSPLTRGKRRGVPAGAGGGGLIPAHAGKTPQRSRAPDSREAHPRSRGENLT